MKPVKFHLLLAAIYILAGMGFVFLSGSAEGLVSPRILVAFVTALIAAIHIAFLVIIFILSFFLSTVKLHARHIAPIIGIVVFAVCNVWGSKIDATRQQETERIGEAILAELRNYKAANGACPDSLEQLRAYSAEVPKPAIRGTEFRYWVSRDGRCTIEFLGPLFVACIRDTDDADWFCD